MNTNKHTLRTRGTKSNSGFTLLEVMTAVLIIGMLLSMAVGGYILARQTGGVASVRGTVQSVKNAVTLYLQRPGGNGTVPLTESTAAAAFPGTITGSPTAAALSAAARLDAVLLAERAMDAPIQIKIGSQRNQPTGTVPLNWNVATQAWTATGAPTMDWSQIARLECRITTPSSQPSAAAGGNFRIDGNTDLPEGARVQYLVVPNVQGTEAAELANSMANINTASAVAANDIGPCVYAAPNADTRLTTLYIYIAHQ